MKASRSIGRHTALPARVLLVLYLGIMLTVCRDPFTITDDAERDLDRPLPGLGEVEGAAVPNYDTRPVWTWIGCEAEGTQVFRFRINGGEWIVTTDLVPDGEGRYSYSPGDHDQDLYPGTYLFEVQERNTAGNWSEAASQSTRVLVQPPVIDEAPGALTEDMAPFFAWSTVDPPQYGNGETGLYSWRLERQTGPGWVVVPEHSKDDQPATAYQVTEELPDGTYRFGVAERNAGGEKSAFFVTEGTMTGDYVEFRSVLFGPAGGWIFYDKGSVSDGWRYLEAAPVDQSAGQRWSNVSDLYSVIGTTLISIGSGVYNSLDIIAQDGHTDSAAQICLELETVNNGTTFNDWFLPSLQELDMMNDELHLNGLGGFVESDDYWSSSENNTRASVVRFPTGIAPGFGPLKATENYVRAARTVRDPGAPAPTYAVRYYANGAQSGDSPVDSYHYEAGESWTVPGQGDLVAPGGHVFAGWNTAPDGTGSPYSPGATNFPAGGNLALYAHWDYIWDGDYHLGDVGPAGGIIFFIDFDNDYPDWTYLEAAPKDREEQYSWADPALLVGAGAQGTALGDGFVNTQNINAVLSGDGQGFERAAPYCWTLSVDYGGDTFTDWFLPSRDELLAMDYLFLSDNAGTLELVYDGNYWTSTEVDIDRAVYVYFEGAPHLPQANTNGMKNNTFYFVRPVRRF